MEDLPAPAFHEEFETQRHEWIGRLLRILLQRRHIHNGREGSPHRMLAVALGNGVMAGSAGIIAHIVHPRPGIPVRRRILLGRLSSMVLALPALPQPLAREDESCDERQDCSSSDRRDDESCSPGAASRVGHVAHAMEIRVFAARAHYEERPSACPTNPLRHPPERCCTRTLEAVRPRTCCQYGTCLCIEWSTWQVAREPLNRPGFRNFLVLQGF